MNFCNKPIKSRSKYNDVVVRCYHHIEPIRLRFNDKGEATLYCSEATTNMEDTLCDITSLDPTMGVDEIDYNDKFFHYRKITILAEVVSVFDFGYDCQIVIESRRNRTIFLH